MIRSPEDNCLICIENEATKTGSHFIPANMIAPCVNKRNEEESFDIDIANGGIDTFFGRGNKKNNEHGLITEKKQNHYMYDYIFCPTCEIELGVLEGKLADDLMVNLRDVNKKDRYWHGQNELGIHLKKFLKVDKIDFLVLFYSIVFRFDISFQIKHDVRLLPGEESEKLRKVINEYLSTGTVVENLEIMKQFHFHLLTKYEFKEDDPTFILSSNTWDEPNIFYLCQFILMWYSETDTPSKKQNPFHNILNNLEEDQNVAFVPEKVWEMMINSVKQFKDNFLVEVGESFSKLNGKSIEENILEFQTLVGELSENDEEKIDLNYSEQAKEQMLKKHILEE